ncbi:MAG: glutaredoxin [Arenicella sp.]|jgi:glutaredoxin
MKTIPQLIIKVSASALLACAGYSSLDDPAWAAKMYKSVDAGGNISYQDRPPPQSAKLIEESELKNSSPKPRLTTRKQNITPVTAYTITNCEDCTHLIRFLKKAKIPVVELSLEDREVQARILRLSGKIAAPTLFIGDTLVTDLSEPGLITILKKAGYTLPESIAPKAADSLTTAPRNSDDSDSKVGVKRAFGGTVRELAD